MSRDGDRWFGTLGPFAGTGTVSWTVAATDASGNVSSPAGSKITVSNCIIG
jgi:hypothetical protein